MPTWMQPAVSGARAGLTKVYPGVDVRDGYSRPAGESSSPSLNSSCKSNADNTATSCSTASSARWPTTTCWAGLGMSDSRRTYKLINGYVHPGDRPGHPSRRSPV